jgi:hypothetical protein
MPTGRPLTTGDLLALLAALLVLLLLLPLRTPATFTRLAVVLAASITTLGVAASVLTYRERPLDATHGLGIVAVTAVLMVPTTAFLAATSTLPTTGLAVLAPAAVRDAAPVALELVVRWALPATLAFPFGLARTPRAWVTVALGVLVALVAAFVVPPSSVVTAQHAGETLARFVGAASLGGPLFVAARSLPDAPGGWVVGVR